MTRGYPGEGWCARGVCMCGALYVADRAKCDHFHPAGPCGWPPEHDEEHIPAGPAKGGWANGEPTFIMKCRRCGNKGGPFVENSGDAGF